MSGSPVNTFEHNGFTVEIHYDDDSFHCNPRDNCNNGLFLGFPHRNYNIGDEQVDPGRWEIPCKACKGEGKRPATLKIGEMEAYNSTCPNTNCKSQGVSFVHDDLSSDDSSDDEQALCPDCDTPLVQSVDCEPCYGTGEVAVESFGDVCEYVKANWNVVGPILPVSMYEHSGVSYSIGFAGNAWDTGDAGIIFATRELLDETQGKGETPSNDDLAEWLKGEVEEYSRWANGEVYGYVIKDVNGDDVESCWGFIGDEYVTEAAKEAVPDAVEMPAKLYSVQLTEAQLTTVWTALLWCKGQLAWGTQIDELQSPLAVVHDALNKAQS